MTHPRPAPPRACGALAALLLVLLLPSLASARARIVVVSADAPGEGFNDPTPAVPVGRNPGKTLGAQRLLAFQFAADRWGQMLDSNVTITVLAAFDSLGPNVLGQAGAWAIYRDFPGAPGFPGAEFSNTWYQSALADKRAGVDLQEYVDPPEPGPDIFAQFSSDAEWYLGLDNNHGALVDLVAVVLHELGHGLGFANFLNEATGAIIEGSTDIYSHYTLDTTTNLLVSDNTDTDADAAAARAAAVARVDKVVWSGRAVTDAVPHVLQFGRPELNVVTPAELADAYRVGTAGFGSPISTPGVSGRVVLVNDGVGVGSDACTPLTAASAAAVSGQIALVDRGSCTFVQKAANVQAAGAAAMLVANTLLGDPPPGLAGVDPSITIVNAMISLELGTSIKAQLAAAVEVRVTLGIDPSQRAGADAADRAQLYATNPVQLGSSISHFDNIALRNQLMEPAINSDLTHQLIPPYDLTLPLMRDVGWFPDNNLDGTPDVYFGYGRCTTRVIDTQLPNGAMLSDQARVWYRTCADQAHKSGAFDRCLAKTTAQSVSKGLLTRAQRNAIEKCGDRLNPWKHK